MSKAKYVDKVFINCPFDKAYESILHAIAFTIYRCGFYPITALNEDDGSVQRLEKIHSCISSCKYGIHDISRAEINSPELPRFNMPLELGIFYGAKKFGDKIQNEKIALVFDSERYRYMKFISDLNGVDIKAHNNLPENVIGSVSTWLRTASKRRTIVGEVTVRTDYIIFKKALPQLLKNAGLTRRKLAFNDYCGFIEQFLPQIL